MSSNDDIRIRETPDGWYFQVSPFYADDETGPFDSESDAEDAAIEAVNRRDAYEDIREGTTRRDRIKEARGNS